MKYLLSILILLSFIGCSDKSDNQIYLRDHGYKDIWCDYQFHCVSVDSVGDVYYSSHPDNKGGEWIKIEKIYESKCK